MSSPPPYHDNMLTYYLPPYEHTSQETNSKDGLNSVEEDIIAPLAKKVNDEMRLLHSEDVLLIQAIMKQETILFIITGNDEQINTNITIFTKIKSANGFRKDQETRTIRKMNMIITNHNIYRVRYHTENTYNSTVFHRVFNNIYKPICMTIYSFYKPLTIQQIKLLSYINDNTISPLSNTPYTFKTTSGIYRLSIRDRLFDSCITNTNNRPLDDIVQKNDIHTIQSARNQFMSIIKLIPGSYTNGDWKQLDGLFGDLYYNEKTNTLSEFPCLNM